MLMENKRTPLFSESLGPCLIQVFTQWDPYKDPPTRQSLYFKVRTRWSRRLGGDSSTLVCSQDPGLHRSVTHISLHGEKLPSQQTDHQEERTKVTPSQKRQNTNTDSQTDCASVFCQASQNMHSWRACEWPSVTYATDGKCNARA